MWQTEEPRFPCVVVTLCCVGSRGQDDKIPDNGSHLAGCGGGGGGGGGGGASKSNINRTAIKLDQQFVGGISSRSFVVLKMMMWQLDTLLVVVVAVLAVDAAKLRECGDGESKG